MSNESTKNKEWANPTPAGLVALAVACFCFFASLTGRVDASAGKLLGCWLLGGFVVQLVVALCDLKAGNTSGGNTFLYFSAFFMLVGGISAFVKASGGVDTRIDGYAWLALTFVVLTWTPAFLKAPLVLFAIVIALDISVPFIALMDMGVIGHEFAVVPAYGLLTCGVLGIYLSAATVVNATFGKTVFPNPKPLLK